MDDIKKLLAQDTADKKRTARGMHHKVRGGGRIVKMPSDYMTKEEIKKLSSPVSEYKLLYPYNWGEFKKLPDHIQLEVWDAISRAFSMNATAFAKMFGCSVPTVCVWMKQHNKKPYGYNEHIHPAEKDRFADFCRSRSVEEPTVVLPVVEEETPTEAAPIEKTPAVEIPPEVLVETPAEEMNPHGIADLIAALIGTGAKLTIEVVL